MADDSTSPPPSAQVQVYDIIFNMIGLQTVGLVGTLVNIFILAVIKKNKSLQTPCFLLIAGECVCSIFVAAGFFVDGIEEAALFTNAIDQNRTRISCHLSRTLFPAWGVQASSMLIMLISLDRLISILNPLGYRRLGKQHAYAGLGLCFTYATAASIGLLLDNQPGFAPNDIIPCQIYFSAFTPGFFDYYGAVNLVFCVSCIVLYGCMLVTFEWRRHRIDSGRSSNTSSDQSHTAFMKQQMACMPMVKLLMTIYIITGVLPAIAVSTASASAVFKPYMPRVYYYGSVLKACTSLAEIIALWFGSRQFRVCAKKMCTKRGLTHREIRLL